MTVILKPRPDKVIKLELEYDQWFALMQCLLKGSGVEKRSSGLHKINHKYGIQFYEDEQ